MGVPTFFPTEDASGIECVDTYFGARMKYLSGRAYHTDVGDIAVVVFKKGEVANFGLFHKIDRGAAGHLLRGVAGKGYSDTFIDDLSEAGAVDAGGGATAPEVWALQVGGGELQQACAQIGRLFGEIFLWQIHFKGGISQSQNPILREGERRPDKDGETRMRIKRFHKKEHIPHDVFLCSEVFMELFIGNRIVQTAVDPAHIIAVVSLNLQPLRGLLQYVVSIAEEELGDEFRAVGGLGAHADNR